MNIDKNLCDCLKLYQNTIITFTITSCSTNSVLAHLVNL